MPFEKIVSPERGSLAEFTAEDRTRWQMYLQKRIEKVQPKCPSDLNTVLRMLVKKGRHVVYSDGTDWVGLMFLDKRETPEPTAGFWRLVGFSCSAADIRNAVPVVMRGVLDWLRDMPGSGVYMITDDLMLDTPEGKAFDEITKQIRKNHGDLLDVTAVADGGSIRRMIRKKQQTGGTL